ncbi:LPXTG cell wall anchor domain-containing protein [Streptomyces sp. NPDC003035]|uniref:LPXTG cell wall anchor domain-containing protein n=1 Tax=Streptomyces sp. NPDC003035 TaxID=3364676 RepID=UPI003674ED7E
MRASVIAVSAGLLAGGLPFLDAQDATAAPRNRCDQKYGLPDTPPPAGSLPGSNGRDATPNAEQYVYDYDNPSLGYDGLQLPASQRELESYGKDPKKWPNDRHKQIYARWNRNQANTDASKRWPRADFDGWLKGVIRLEGNGKRGAQFERQVTRHYKLAGPDWLCQGSLKGIDKKLHEELKKELGDKFPNKDRRFDAVNPRTKTIYEYKAGGRFDYKEIHVDKALASRGWKVVYIFGEEPDEATKRKLAEVDADGKGKIGNYKHTATPQPKYNNNTGYNKPSGSLNPACQTPRTGTMNLAAAGGICSANGAADRTANGSPKNREQARRVAAAERADGNASQRMRGPGGVDFSTLELRYVGTPVDGKGLDYSYKAGINPDADENPSFGGEEKAQLVSDSFFTWMALTPEKFWVNLNPDEPNRVMEEKFGTTDAGRVLLEADLQMKHDYAAFLNPKDADAARVWDSLTRVDGAPCLHSVRNWIEPKPAQVREQDGGIYILDAPLKVKSVPQEFSAPVPGEKCHLTEAQIQHNHRLIEQYVIPKIEEKINKSDEPIYADLRRVYTSRVAAEWVMQQDRKKAGDYHRIIGSNDVKSWPIRGEKWDKNDVYQKYVKSFREGDYSFEREYGGLVYTYSVGGVDFSKAPKKNIPKVRFDLENPRLPQVTDRSKIAPRDYRDTGTQLLGGSTHVTPSGDPTPEPTPTPTGTGKPDPSPTPTDPSSPAPSTPAPTDGGHTQPPSADGGLADTGTRVGTVAGLAAALLAAGGAVIWWKRRRNSTAH